MNDLQLTRHDLIRLACLHEGIVASIYRLEEGMAGRPAILKILHPEALAQGLGTRLDNEFAVTRDLEIPGVRRALALLNIDGSPALVLDYIAGTTLKKAFCETRRPLAEILAVTCSICRTLDELHRRRLVHRNIASTHIMTGPEGREAIIIDFSRATAVSGKAQQEAPDLPARHLHYLAPEQTGRMNRPVDHRADLYSLGVVVYEMLAGELPFPTGNTAELIHCHLARNPQPVREKRPEVPRMVSDMVAKLLAKNPDDRYQSAAGLMADLELCLAQLRQGGMIEEFALAREDEAARFAIPDGLYGRERERQLLFQAVEEATAGKGGMLFVTGNEGVGKTSLVREVQPYVAEKKGCFAGGRYDERQKNSPYHGLIQAIEAVVDLLLTENAEQAAWWTAGLRDGLGKSAGLLAEFIPKLELLLGRQQPVREPVPLENPHEFLSAVDRFIQTVAEARGPLVLFLDNLQWADHASLELLRFLGEGLARRRMLLLAAYRDNEIEAASPLAAVLSEMQQAGVDFRTLHLENLSRGALGSLVAETLKTEPSYSQSLTDLIYEKTGGNALFARQFFQTLHDESLLARVGFPKHWEWDTGMIRVLGITDNVVALMTRKVGKMPKATQELLAVAACFGNSFNLDRLAAVTSRPRDDTHEDVRRAVEEGLLLLTAAPGEHYAFLHDRVRQVAYSLLSRKKRRTAHLAIGRLLMQEFQGEEAEQMVFTIADHLNEGFPHLDSPREKLGLVRLNLSAGRKANRAAAYRAAIWYLSMGIGMLGQDKWKKHYDLAAGLYFEAVEAEYLSSNYERAELLSAELLRYVVDLLDKVKILELRIRSYAAQSRNDAAIATGREALRLLGLDLPDKTEDAGSRAAEMRKELDEEMHAGKDPAGLPVERDAHQLAARRILMTLAGPVHQSRPEMLPAIVLQAVLLSMKSGNSPMSAFAYGWYAGLLCGPYRDIRTCRRYGGIALAVLETFKSAALETRVLFIYNALVRPWQEHAEETAFALQEIYRKGLSSGDLEYTHNAAVHATGYLFCAGKSLPLVRSLQEEYLEAAERLRLEFHAQCLRTWCQALNALTGSAGDAAPEYLSANVRNLPNWIARHEPLLVFNTLCCRTMLQYLFGDYPGAVETAGLCEAYEKSGEGYLYYAVHLFYTAMALLARLPGEGAQTRQEYLKKVSAIQERMREWAHHAPMNFQHKSDLIEAERARVTGEHFLALNCFGRAIQGARRHGYLQEEALAYEREAQLHLAMGREDLASFAIARAVAGYRQWGALRQAEDLQRRYRQVPGMEQSVPLDTAAILDASRVLSREIRLDRLLDRLMHLVMESAGAERGVLIESRDSRLIVRATGEVGREEIVTAQETPVGEDGRVALSVVNYVARTEIPVVLHDASRDRVYGGDPVIASRGVRSLLCLPLVHQGKLSGLLYLENNLATGVFTENRLALLQAISSQAAISIENAKLYTHLEATIRELSQAEAAVRDSQSLLKAIIDNSTAVIYVKDLSGRYLLINRQFEELFHIGQETALGRTDFDIFPAETAEAFRLFDRQVLDHGSTLESEETAPHDDGSHTYISIKCPLFSNEGRPYAVFGISTDITERKRVEQALVESERKFRAIFEQTFQLIGLLTVDGTVIAANRAALGVVGLPETDIVGRPFWETPWWSHSPALQARLEAAVKEAAAGEFVRFEASHPAVDGGLRYVDFSLKPVRDETGNVVLLIPEGRDITERKQAEEELKKHRDHLDELVQQRTAQLIRANELLHQEIAERKTIEEELMVARDHAEAASRAKTTFLSSMSHELRTPLNAILGYAQILKHQENLTETQQQQLEIMRSSGEHLLMLINDILDVGRIEASKIELQEETFHLPSFLRQVFNITRIKTDEKDLLFDYQASPSLPEYVRGDERKLKQILLNLLGNAVKYTRRGRIILRVFPLAEEGLRFEVTDTGIGIPPDKLEMIFEPFTQLATEGQPHEGTGLGLTITRQLVELMRGRLGVESEPGKGSTFGVTVPIFEVAAAEVAAPQAGSTVTGYCGPPKEILVVDDYSANASLLVSLLAPLGFAVRTAESGPAALGQATAHPPDLVILDLVMPEMDGLATLREMRRRPELSATRVIGVSATVTDNGSKKEFAAECDDFLVKPVAIDVLLEKIGTILGIAWESGPAPLLKVKSEQEAEEPAGEIPPPEAMAELHELALRGDLRGIQAWISGLEGNAGRYGPFTARLRRLVGRFKTKAVLALVEQHLPEKT